MNNSSSTASSSTTGTALPSEILPYLYVGTYRHALNESTLRELGITYLLNLKGRCRYPENRAIRFKHVPLSDYGDQDLAHVRFVKCFDFIQEAKQRNQRILIHCSRGINRAPTICLAYLISCEHMTLRQAYQLVTTFRPQASPHNAYFVQLQLLDQRIHGSVSLQLEDIDPIIQQLVHRSPKVREADETSVDRASTLTNHSGSTLGTARSCPTAVSTCDEESEDMEHYVRRRKKEKCTIS